MEAYQTLLCSLISLFSTRLRFSRFLNTRSITMDPSKLAIAFKPMDEDAELQSSPTPWFVVTKALSEVYYKGLPSEPLLIATTNPSPFEDPTGLEAYSVLKELRELGNHPLASVWDHGLADRLRRSLNMTCVNWTSIEALRIVKDGESSGPVIVWIGVEFGALTFEEGSNVAFNCHAFINRYGFRDYHVEIKESLTFGIPISTKDRPWAEGTGSFYLSAGGDDKGNNRECERRNNSRAHEDMTYTLDLAVIKIDAGKLDANNYCGNTINIGDKYTCQEFMEKVSKTVLMNPCEPCLVIFKNGANTLTTISKANNVSSYMCTHFAGKYWELREWLIIPTDKNSGPFSRKGDSGSCITDIFCRIVGILTGSSGATDSSDVTYVTPISFIMKVLHTTKFFKYAHLKPVLI
ncbi:uncharacterized protein BT62DRAFT_1046042 [Guyanagaster necrorhizus]|uniref:Uncharacterized protein n=1 Tax=Guyanagaster necrorhizus TaxID=856835 RepID=A0A9P7W2B2_9AGAR|nr:uncharacterized protein BT62DRAFT_1046042 [Guyanagaster necrorhizus MCA 3950]KAG7450882.1 hypothetical protein BT62DRAFT_1046042 [Guyanagaster necrorhizus MCA 3950]